ncbi:hypothetical protein BC834DRAFT_922815 [Gloeopeniophorella convolvens]|nr:hypothetical protein BC834DRAFT_922815 [Gloeopeniophorella convolvens]
MKYVALLSGGKDSCFNLLHCHKHGHEMIAAASLCPEQGKEELDSYMYQTVGQDAIEFVARALEVPLYRKVISGAALVQDSEYGGRDAKNRGGTDGDETEDLYALLADVKSRHPDVQGVSVGAILSNYQRVRVEHVCQRLSLTPLCYLWQRDQAELLSEMIDAGMEAILIKVAGIGLTTKHLGKSLSEMQPTLTKLNTLYGSHICGEGGEYETLTLDCPLFKHRVNLLETETVVHSDSGFATVAFLRIRSAELSAKPEHPIEVTVPALLDDPYNDVAEQVRNAIAEDEHSETSNQARHIPSHSPVNYHTTRHRAKRVGNWVAIGNIHRDIDNAPAVSLEAEVRECFDTLQRCLHEHSLSLSQLTNINIFISDMKDFAAINAVYATYFGVSPPARACVAVDMVHALRVTLDCVAYAEQKSSDRQALHVQGLSYWAPANIGPYSQTIIADERVFVSGQIGLIPSSLTLPSPRDLAMEIPLSSQHADRVIAAVASNAGGGWTGHAQTILYWLAHESHMPHVKMAAKSLDRDNKAPSLFVVVKELPKGALVEKQVLYHTGRGAVVDEDGDSSLESRPPSYDSGTASVSHTDRPSSEVWYEVSYFPHTAASGTIICGRGQNGAAALQRLRTVASLEDKLAHMISVRLFYNTTARDVFGPDGPAVTHIPCRSISTRDQNNWDYALCILTA